MERAHSRSPQNPALAALLAFASRIVSGVSRDDQVTGGQASQILATAAGLIAPLVAPPSVVAQQVRIGASAASGSIRLCSAFIYILQASELRFPGAARLELAVAAPAHDQ